jgi:hypothetical protein
MRRRDNGGMTITILLLVMFAAAVLGVGILAVARRQPRSASHATGGDAGSFVWMHGGGDGSGAGDCGGDSGGGGCDGGGGGGGGD